jgi:hypothetical protein
VTVLNLWALFAIMRIGTNLDQPEILLFLLSIFPCVAFVAPISIVVHWIAGDAGKAAADKFNFFGNEAESYHDHV